MGTGKATRLSKVAREFNVGIATIVEFLHKKGFNIDSNPNTKVSPELYDILVKEYSSDINAKKESEKLSLNQLRNKKEAVSINDIDEEQEDQEEETEDDDSFTSDEEILIKDVSSPQKPVAPKEEKPVEESKPQQPEEKTKAESKEKEEPKTETTKKEEKPSEEKEEEQKESVKVIGKIDLSSLNQKTRPDKKTKKQKESERKQVDQKAEEKKETKTQKPETSAKEDYQTAEEKKPVQEQDSQLYKSKIEKLSGPTVVGKINLPTPEDKKKKPVASSNDQKSKKKKRKRIHKEKVDLEDKKDTKKTPDKKKDKEHFKSKRKKKKQLRPEVSEEDVQKQIKETLARLTSKGKSKGSKHRREKRDTISQKQQEELKKQEEDKKVLKVTEFVSVNELANMMNVSPKEVISVCMNLGLMVSINQRLDAETMALVADEFNYTVDFISVEVQEAINEEEDREEDLLSRSPIVTVLGHVDHGKPSLLDHIRKSNVIAGEAGGITQHIGAYSVIVDDNKTITFLDTPGHEAFTAMRARGAQITDVAIIVVAADDNVMPQTVEAINHASAAGVPMIFAINKVDKPGASPEWIKEELANMSYLVEEWGGKYQSQNISATKGEYINELLEKVLLESELLDLKANPNKNAIGTVLESWLDKGRGYVSNILVQAGKMKITDVILAGSHMGRAKAMFNERGKEIHEVGPSQPVQLLGLSGAPQAGDKFNVMDTEKEAKEIANRRAQLEREQSMRTQKHITLDEIGRRIAIGNFKEVNLVLKGDVDGSIEALSDAFAKLSTEELQVNIIHKGVGQITESDILLAAASNAIIIGFQVRPSASAKKIAGKEQIDIRLYSVIYDAINDMRDAMEGMLSPEIKEEVTGSAEVKETFKIKKVGTMAGCIVRDGKLERNSKVRVIRDGIVIYTGELESLKRFKEDVKEVREGYECGLNVKNFNDIKVGDFIEGFKEVEVKKSLETR